MGSCFQTKRESFVYRAMAAWRRSSRPKSQYVIFMLFTMRVFSPW